MGEGCDEDELNIFIIRFVDYRRFILLMRLRKK